MLSKGSKYNGGHDEAPRGHRSVESAAERDAGTVKPVIFVSSMWSTIFAGGAGPPLDSEKAQVRTTSDCHTAQVLVWRCI